jgi:hypothetical protein
MAVSMVGDTESEQELAESHLMLKDSWALGVLALFQDIILFRRQQSLTADSLI